MSSLPYVNTPYFKTGRASDLTGFDRVLYRFFEMLPGFLSWGTIILIFVASAFVPVWAAYFIIAFDLYWLLKTSYLSVHLRHNWKRVKYNMNLDWLELTEKLKYDHLRHLVILPFYKEGIEVVEHSIKTILSTRYNHKNILIVLAAEARAGADALAVAEEIKRRYASSFGSLLITVHPADLPGEMAGKGSNINYAAERSRVELLDPQQIPYEDVIVSAFDVDTAPYPDYFLCLTWHFLTHPNPHKASFQPVPFYYNNIWDVPAISRVVATSSTFWQMVQQERPEKLATFSSHAVSFKALHEIGYWQTNMVSEDSRIYWNLFLAHDGDWETVPISYPVSMDANLAPKFWQTLANIYRQHRRWTWGAENLPYLLMGFVKNPRIPFWKKFTTAFVQLEGFWSLATNPIMIFLLGWMPLILGGRVFNETVLSYNLPIITRNLMIIAMFGLVLSAIISISLLPPIPEFVKKTRFRITMVLQWVLVPFTLVIFGAIPGLDAQTRLMLGRYMGFWVTPKHRAETAPSIAGKGEGG